MTESVARAAVRAGVRIVTGDTKVVGRGAADGLFVNTAGIGLVAPGVDRRRRSGRRRRRRHPVRARSACTASPS